MVIGFVHHAAVEFAVTANLEKRLKMLWMEVFSFVTNASVNVGQKSSNYG